MNTLSLIPQVQSLVMHAGCFILDMQMPFTISAPGIFTEDVMLFIEQMCPVNGMPLFQLTQDASSSLSLYVDSSVSHEEGYTVDINAKNIEIRSRTACGAFYALQTLRQIFLTYDGCIPCCRIEDFPQYEWRGLMLDTVRTFYSVAFIKKMIDALALHRMNRFHWHLTDDQGWRLPVPDFSLLTDVGSVRLDRRFTWDAERGGVYSHDDIRDIVSFAQKRHILVIPEIETPGHASAVLTAYPELGCTGGPYQVEDRFGIFKEVLCAGNDAVFPLFEAVFDTVVKLFPSPYIHIGGDECPRDRWRECPKCAQRIRDEGLRDADELQSWITVRFAQMVEKRGKIPIGWDEVLDGTECLGLPKTMIIQSWRGIEGGIKASARGHKVIMSPLTDGCYLDYKPAASVEEPGASRVITVRDSYNYSPIPAGLSEDQKKCILGGQGNLWTEVIYASKIAEYMIFPRLCAISESLWISSDKKDFDSFANRLKVHKNRLKALDILYFDGILS